MSEPRPTRLDAVMIMIALAVVAGGVGVSFLFQSRRLSDAGNTNTALRSLVSAEGDFRSNDRDGNGVNDFWTGDVKGLYTLTRAAVPGTAGAKPEDSLRLIPLLYAMADADGTMVPAGGENVPFGSFSTLHSPYKGHWLAALLTDRNLTTTKDANYRQDTGGKPPMGECHHPSKFGFVSFPDSSSAGMFVYMVNEHNTIWRSATTASVKTKSGSPPGLDGIQPVYLHWPSDQDLKQYWQHLHDERP
jgi:hypothetical protein